MYRGSLPEPAAADTLTDMGGRIGWVTRVNLGIAWTAGVALALSAVLLAIAGDFVGQDAHAYWMAVQGGGLYDAAPTQADAYLYSPAFALAIWPLGQLPWWGFFTVWVLLEGLALAWLVRPLPTRWAIPVLLACVPELVIGNIYLLIALMVALGVRHPAVWAFGVLTKITPGVGALWFLFRREWAALLVAVGSTAVVMLTSVLVTPRWWLDWIDFLRDHAGDGDPTFVPRCVLGLALVAWAARTGRAWVLAPAVTIVAPVLTAFACLTPLVAIPRLLRSDPSTTDSDGEAVPRSKGRVGERGARA